MVATFPVIKVLLITALGLFLALDGISILGADARKTTNQVTQKKKSIFLLLCFCFSLMQFAEKDVLSVTACVLCV